jgi:hypothetical protein
VITEIQFIILSVLMPLQKRWNLLTKCNETWLDYCANRGNTVVFVLCIRAIVSFLDISIDISSSVGLKTCEVAEAVAALATGALYDHRFEKYAIFTEAF